MPAGLRYCLGRPAAATLLATLENTARAAMAISLKSAPSEPPLGKACQPRTTTLRPAPAVRSDVPQPARAAALRRCTAACGKRSCRGLYADKDGWCAPCADGCRCGRARANALPGCLGCCCHPGGCLGGLSAQQCPRGAISCTPTPPPLPPTPTPTPTCSECATNGTCIACGSKGLAKDGTCQVRRRNRGSSGCRAGALLPFPMLHCPATAPGTAPRTSWA